MPDKVLGNDPFAEMGMQAPSDRKAGPTRSAPKSKSVKTQKAEPQKQTPEAGKSDRKAVPANKTGQGKSVAAAKKEPAKKNAGAKPEQSPKKVKPQSEMLALPIEEKKTIETVQATEEAATNLPRTDKPDNNSEDVNSLETDRLMRNVADDPVCLRRLQPLLDILYRRVRRVKVEGMENIPAGGCAVLVANHAGLTPYDSLMIRSALRLEHPHKRDVRPLMEDFIYHLPLLGTLLYKLGMARACTEDATAVLKNDELALVFLEGMGIRPKPYSRRHELQRFSRGGFVRLALNLSAPIIPVALAFSEGNGSGRLPSNLMPPSLRIVIGKPLDVGSHSADAADNPSLVSKLVYEIKSTIQGMLDKELEKKNRRC